MAEGVTLLVGTTKGLFLLQSDGDRAAWAVRGPFCGGWAINHAASDASGRIWAAGGGAWSGAGVWRFDGADWALTRLSKGETDAWAEANPEEAAMFGMARDDAPAFGTDVDSIWSIHHRDGVLWAGARPADLFRSDDLGETWTRVDAFRNQPDRDDWNPGAAGLTLHTILTDPADARKIWLGVSAAGVFASEDGGATWERRNRRSNAPVEVNRATDPFGDPENIGLCVHNMVRAPSAPGDLIYMQNHHGVWRSRDGGRSWDDIAAGLPSTFGFPIGVHPRDPERIWTLPLNSDQDGRWPPGNAAAVWTSADGGGSWEARRAGLPQEACFFTVLRQAMATDHGAPAGVYFGTNSGSVFASADEGGSWTEAARHLPTVLCVEVMAR